MEQNTINRIALGVKVFGGTLLVACVVAMVWRLFH